ncbi:MAG: FKBP-type peptidyl-prolyl cis-trans isomerase [Bacteroidales bacterium]|jgi:FKBP-type peptidyl-prolyl cis-trans isomerase FklB|nr:FKBP-type peptidyl-prolyl cis-trans isomerase [Bacteroidales bacterium]
MRKILFPLIGLLFLLSGSSVFGQTLKNGVDSASYALGVSFAENMMKSGFVDIDVDILAKAFKDRIVEKDVLISDNDANSFLNKYFMNLKLKAEEMAIAKEKAFLGENKKREGVIETASGIQYEVIKKGKGNKPFAHNKVKVHYVGTLENGKEFDNSYKRNDPLVIKLSSVIKGWEEGVQLMNVGAKYKFYIPSALGYGKRGAGSDIPPNSLLIFEIELLEIVE